MMKPTLLLAVIGVAITGLFGYHGIYVRQQEQVRLIQTQIGQEHADQTVRADTAALLQELERYRDRLPSEPDPSWLVNEVVVPSERAGIELTALTQDAPQPLQKFTRLSVTLRLRATYHQLGVFLDQLEHSDRYLRVESLDVSPPTDASGIASASVVLSTVYMPPVASLTTGRP
jgi:Tfp pilus assembly protein PilO